MTDVSFVVPAWNEAGGIAATLASLRGAGEAAVPGRYEIVVVDNASTDGTAAIAETSGARVVHEPHRQIARARNRGAREARGRFLVFVDADTLVSPEVVRQALEAMGTGGVVGGGSVLRFSGGNSLARGAVGLWNRISRRMSWAAGSFLFCRREAWEGVGGFDEGLYAGEEIGFSRAVSRWGRARGLGFRILSAHPPVTSSRKMEGAKATWRALLQLLVINACPLLVRSRWACFLWYQARRGETGVSASARLR